MSHKNTRLQKMARREWKKMDNANAFITKESKWVETKNKYGMLEYQLMMLPARPKFGTMNT